MSEIREKWIGGGVAPEITGRCTNPTQYILAILSSIHYGNPAYISDRILSFWGSVYLKKAAFTAALKAEQRNYEQGLTLTTLSKLIKKNNPNVAWAEVYPTYPSSITLYALHIGLSLSSTSKIPTYNLNILGGDPWILYTTYDSDSLSSILDTIFAVPHDILTVYSRYAQLLPQITIPFPPRYMKNVLLFSPDQTLMQIRATLQRCTNQLSLYPLRIRLLPSHTNVAPGGSLWVDASLPYSAVYSQRETQLSPYRWSLVGDTFTCSRTSGSTFFAAAYASLFDPGFFPFFAPAVDGVRVDQGVPAQLAFPRIQDKSRRILYPFLPSTHFGRPWETTPTEEAMAEIDSAFEDVPTVSILMRE